MSGLSIHFWILMAYLFLALSLVDEHFATLEKIRPRSLLGPPPWACGSAMGHPSTMVAGALADGRAAAICLAQHDDLRVSRSGLPPTI